MIDALIQGRVCGSPKQAIGKTGKPYTTVKVRVSTGGGEMMTCSVLCFDAQAQLELVALGDGDTVALVGPLKPKTYQAKNGEWRVGLDLVAHHVTTAYHLQHKRQAMQGGGDE